MVVVRKGGIWIAGARGGHPVEVVPARRIHDVPFDPVWSPDATKIAFAVVRDEEAPRDTVKEFEEIWTVAANGTELRKLGSGSSPAWSADGRRIAYARRDGSVAWARSDGGDEVVLEHLGGYTRSLDLSPDGRRLVFQNRNSVKVLDVRTGRMRGFPEKRAGNPVQVRWTPDGRRIAYLQWNVTKNGPWDPSEVRTIRPNGRGMRVVLTVREQLLPFKFSWQAR
jgi:Tol biopolymer transport system component